MGHVVTIDAPEDFQRCVLDRASGGCRRPRRAFATGTRRPRNHCGINGGGCPRSRRCRMQLRLL